MNFKDWCNITEISEELYKNAEELGSIPREIIQKWINYDPELKSISQRRTFTTLFGWAVPCKEAVELIKSHCKGPLYDVMAGTGYWSRILKKAGIDVRTSDIHKILDKNYYHRNELKKDMYKFDFDMNPEKTKIRRKNALRIGYDLSRKRILGDLFLCWPPYQCPTATDILDLVPIGTKVFYVGEEESGCTGDLSFHKTLEKNFRFIVNEDLPNFDGIHDDLTVYEKVREGSVDRKYRGKAFSWDIDDE